ncbi:MAG: glycosyltransferase family 9 protein, partial [Chitinophagales bacterium]
MLKILLIRFSSIGDIVLTTPVVRCLKKQQTAVEIHYLTKASFKILIANNPYIDKVHLFKNDLKTLIQQLKAEQFDYVIDLHHNLRTLRIKQALGVKSNSFDKINVAKWLMVNMKWNRLPKVHIVDRYLDTLQALPFSIQNDGAGLDYFIPEKDKVNIVTHFPAIGERPYVAMTVGAAHHTKCLPIRQQMNLCEIIEYPVILLGSSVDADAGD